ncbi:hypothetical protein RRG08_001700 [Elysia crispata]|uniref:Reverse transcriptase/retrotransposon-derived protein RNase H-like domain-containing protein n=1 Tax=Elysia crispata TaxID=231223 RepID=A0AAE1AKP9_9GAST|nr:hypothetical protein RRG08_001700 [Elysia crispata]
MKGRKKDQVYTVDVLDALYRISEAWSLVKEQFLPGIAKLLAPLTEATKSRGKVITWTDECQTAFEAAKSSLASATLLNHPDPNLKAALKARLLGPGWMDELPIVLLGIRSTWKEDLDAAPALLTYGTNLRIPSDFFPSNSAERISPGSTFVRDLQENFCKLSPLSPVHHGTTKKYLPRDLMSAEQVYVGHVAHRGPLVRPYDGPFKVLYRSDKHFDILRNNKSTRVSIDRLKPAYSADPKFPPPAVHPHDQAPRVDDNSRSETVSDKKDLVVEDGDDEEVPLSLPPPTVTEARDVIKTLRHFIESQSSTDHQLDRISNLNDYVEKNLSLRHFIESQSGTDHQLDRISNLK